MLGISEAIASFKTDVTLGDLLGVATVVFLAIGGWAWNAWRASHPFAMRFCNNPTDLTGVDQIRVFHTRWEASIGKQTLCLEIKTRQAIRKFYKFDIRFQRRPWFFRDWEPAKRELIEIVGIKVPEWQRETQTTYGAIGKDTNPDPVGGGAMARSW